MSIFTFAQDVNTLKHVYESQLVYLIKQHNIPVSAAFDTMLKLGFNRGLTKQLEAEYWKENEKEH